MLLFIIVIVVTAALGLWHKSFVANLKKLEDDHKYIELSHQMAGASLLSGCNWAWFVVMVFLSLSHTWWLFVVYMGIASYLAWGTMSNVYKEKGHGNDQSVELARHSGSDTQLR